VFHRELSHRAVVGAVRTVMGPGVKCLHSMLFIKAPGKPGQAWRQDEDPVPYRDRSLNGCWIALDPATVDKD
jgi:ectoine hydroxylase-related dioxygenase (phytanoyl-CoA dioxygenase family)